ncbi:MAG TPA: hypothetical protein VFP58_14260 [Candidatus Eisenbacteria bacterium]|nr:hypothetical protein [Candidatus Eisenbacteria bacterium]
MLILPAPAWSAAWTRDPGEIYAKASAAWLDASEMYDEEGVVGPIQDSLLYRDPAYRELWASLYVEVGVHRAITLVAGIPVKLARQEATGRTGVPDLEGETFGLGAMRLGFRVPLHRGSWRASLEPEWILPLYGDPDRVEDPLLGTGFMDLGTAVSLGTGLSSLSGYAQGTVGYRIRGGSIPEEAYWDVEVGSEPWPRLMVRVRYDGLSSRGQLTDVPAGGTPAPGLGGQDHHRIAPSVALGTGGGSELSLTWRRVVDGRSTLRSSEWELAFAFLGLVRDGADRAED